MTEPYRFPDLPIEPIDAGSTVMVLGPAHSGARRLALRLSAAQAGEGTITITTNARAERVVAKFRQAGLNTDESAIAFVDCVGNDETVEGLPVVCVSSPDDLTGIGMQFSKLYRDRYTSGTRRMRTTLYSLSTLLTLTDLKPASRFLHVMAGRIDNADGLGVMLVDPRVHDDRTLGTISQFCDGRVEVEERDGKPHLRTRGLDGQPREWVPFEPEA